MDYQWYPGHMTRAKRMMQENIKLIDLLIELTDARAPLSGRNPDIDALAQGKARVIVLNKSDLADEAANRAWKEYFEKKGFLACLTDSRSSASVTKVKTLVDEACRQKIERDRKRGIMNRPVRAMIAGIPNVGKSTFINSFAGKAVAKTGNKPGVTKGKQWIRLNGNVELLDTPGILWPKFEDQQIGRRLAVLGSIRDELQDFQELGLWLADYLLSAYHIEGMSELALKHRNKIILTDAPTGVENVQMILEAIDQKRGIECDYYSYKNNTLKEHLLIPYFLRTWENRWYLNSCCGTGRNWRSWNRKAFGRR